MKWYFAVMLALCFALASAGPGLAQDVRGLDRAKEGVSYGTQKAIETLTGLLETVPEVARPSIQREIEMKRASRDRAMGALDGAYVDPYEGRYDDAYDGGTDGGPPPHAGRGAPPHDQGGPPPHAGHGPPPHAQGGPPPFARGGPPAFVERGGYRAGRGGFGGPRGRR